jgi:transcriptional regulator with XRE-family HTH domain
MATFGERIRALRVEKNVPLRVVAAAVEIDSTLLSRFELGDRFPTDEQIKRFADYFQKPVDEFSAQVIADRILDSYGHDAVMLKAAEIVKERIAEYAVHKDEK